MTTSPQNLLKVRGIFQRYTGLPAVSLGIQHYVDKDGKYRGGGGYHAGNDLLAMIGKLNTDYSKRQSEKDRPGSNEASGIDIGYFDVVLPNKRRVTLRTLSEWTIANWNAEDAQWIRELIYSLDGQTVRRKDRLGHSTTGDDSHTTHNHYSKFRDVTDDSPVRFFQRFWDEMSAQTPEKKVLGGVDKMFAVVQYGKAPDVYEARDGKLYPVNDPDKVKRLIRLGANKSFCSGFYGGDGPFASKEEMEDTCGPIVETVGDTEGTH